MTTSREDTRGAATSAAPPGALPPPTATCSRHAFYDPACLGCHESYREQVELERQQRDGDLPGVTMKIPTMPPVSPESDGDRSSVPEAEAEAEAGEEYVGPRVWKATELDSARALEFLAARRVPRAAVSYMLGPEGIGKSLWFVWLTAIITTGKPFPEFGIPARNPGYVVLVLTEDDWATIARPRLELAGADLNYVRVICSESDGSGTPTFPRHMPIVAEAAKGAVLVIVDAWADTLPPGANVKDSERSRQIMHPWKDLATRTGVAVILSGHTNRLKDSNVRNVYAMSASLRQKARMTILAQPDPDDSSIMLIGPEKSNVVGEVPASKFRIETSQVFERTEDSDGTVPKLVWVGNSEQSARALFVDAAAAENGDGADDRNEIDDWLTALLSQGSVKANDVFQAADANGFSKDQVKRAKRRIKAKAERPQNPGPWFWSLPAFAADAGSREQ